MALSWVDIPAGSNPHRTALTIREKFMLDAGQEQGPMPVIVVVSRARLGCHFKFNNLFSLGDPAKFTATLSKLSFNVFTVKAISCFPRSLQFAVIEREGG